MFCSSLGDFVFAASLELRTYHLDTFLCTLSFSVCVLLIGFSLCIMVRILHLNVLVKKARRRSSSFLQINFAQNNAVYDRSKGWILFFGHYNDRSSYQQIYIFWFLLRVVIFNTVIANLYAYPLAKTGQ